MNAITLVNLLVLGASCFAFGFSWKSVASYFSAFVIVVELLLLLGFIR